MEVEIDGFVALKHRKADFEREPWVIQTLHAGVGFSVSLTTNLDEARRIRDAWIAAVARAEAEIELCGPNCDLCR